MKKVLFVASEGLPYIKSGGLADVIGSLPIALQENDCEVRVVLPLYLNIVDKYFEDLSEVVKYTVSIGYEEVPVTLYEALYEGVIYYFIEHQRYFERKELYGYPDDGERFAYFQKAVLEMLNQINYFPHILHCHDWHTGMIPAMCKENFSQDKRYAKMKHVYTIHNLAYQGNFSKDMLESCLGLSEDVFYNGNVRFDDGISFMKSGIVYADMVTTVSPNYAQEILTSEYGEHLEHVLQMKAQRLCGIVNGIDTEIWDPKTDSYLEENFSKVNVFKQKGINKQALQKKLGLKIDNDIFLLGMVTRLTSQKGLDLVLSQIPEMVKAKMQVVILGSGDNHLEKELKLIENGNKGNFAFYKGYSEELAHQIYASCDGFLMPSKFEPCGISQLISMHYGTLPIVRETGGLKDTVVAYNKYTEEGTGFSFTNYNGWEMMDCINRTLDVYYNHSKSFRKLVKQAMKYDVDWGVSAKAYCKIYKKI